MKLLTARSLVCVVLLFLVAAACTPRSGSKSPTPSSKTTAAPTTTTTRPVLNPTGTPTISPRPSPLSPKILNITVDLATSAAGFSVRSIVVSAGSSILVNFHNLDAGVAHNFAVYADSNANTPIYQGTVVNGPGTASYQFKAPSTPGIYFFRCDYHPVSMRGELVVQ